MNLSAAAAPSELRLEKPQFAELQPSETVPTRQLVLRVLWIAVRLIVAYWLAWQAQPFFYQRF